MSQKSLVPVNALSSASAPSTPTLRSGDLYYNTTTGLQVYNGTAWVSAGSAGITGVTAGTGLTGGGTSGTVTVSLSTPVSVANGGTGVTTSTGTGSTVLSAAPTLTGTVTASGIINMTATGGFGNLKDYQTLNLMGCL